MVNTRGSKRIVDARDRLINAYWHLVKTRPATEITVDMVTRQAAINRTSFYYHFKNLDGLAQETLLRSASVQPYRTIVQQLTLRDRMQPGDASTSEGDWRELLDDVCTAVFLSTRSGAFKASVDNLCHVWNETLLPSRDEHPSDGPHEGQGDGVREGRARAVDDQQAAGDQCDEAPANGDQERENEDRAVLLSAIAHSFLSLLAQRGAAGNAMPAERFVELIYKAHIPQALAEL